MSRIASAGTRRGASASTPRPNSTRVDSGYLHRSELPLTSLVFLLPLIVLYEFGTWRFATDPAHHVEQRIIAFNLMRQFFGFFGATGQFLPPLAVVGLLLAWHVARRDPWRVRASHVAGMALESALLAIPLLAMGFVLARYLPLFQASSNGANLLILSIGAGVYEEMVFRLLAFTCMSLLFIDVLGMRKGWAYLLMVVGSAMLFSFYHYLGDETFGLRTFAFRTAAGLYFGAVFVFRGFGVTAGSHAAYDISVVVLRWIL